MSEKIKTGSVLQGMVRLTADATVGVTGVVEDFHRKVVHPSFLPSTPIQHLITMISGWTFKSIRGVARFTGDGIDKTLGKLAPLLGDLTSTASGEAMRSALNGVIGDHLQKTENPLEINMQFRHKGKTINPDADSIRRTFPNVNGRIVLMIHGLCMNDLQFTRKEHNHGTALAEELDGIPLYLQYNSGRHISSNGQDLNDLLEQLILQWPVPVDELIVVAHSMGGLLLRSALHTGQQRKSTWTRHLRKCVFLGTPHHGANLERIGNHVDIALGAFSYAKPFARLGQIRSAGITDLRYGNLVDEDWNRFDRFKKEKDQRKYIPLPASVSCFAIAGALGKAPGSSSTELIGDGLVDIGSALGQHKDPEKALHFREEHTYVAYQTAHLDLLNKPEIYARIRSWLQ